jgi:hypothetical protein
MRKTDEVWWWLRLPPVHRRGTCVSEVSTAEEDQRPQQPFDVARAPSLPELLLQMPQDDERFERLGMNRASFTPKVPSR